MTDAHISVNELQPHELNKEIYTNRNINELAEKIETYGFRENQPLLVTHDEKILSGHRRWRAAKEVGLDTVPVRYVSPDSETDELFTLLLANEYRDKTAAEKINEAEAWERIEREKAKERMSEGGKGTQKLADAKTGEAKEKAAEKVGASKETVRKGQKIKEKAEGGDETAQKEWEQMESGEQSIHGAYRNIKKDENATPEPDEQSGETTTTTTPEYEWVNTTPKDIDVQARDCDAAGEYRICVKGDEYGIGAELYSKLFSDNP